MYIRRTITSNKNTKIEVFSDDTCTDRKKLIINRCSVKAEQELTYYLNMMKGIKGYIEGQAAWRNRD